ncbi:MAG: hypothetical protein RJA21_881, partial [Gemmatimonadota bacterium]
WAGSPWSALPVAVPSAWSPPFGARADASALTRLRYSIWVLMHDETRQLFAMRA